MDEKLHPDFFLYIKDELCIFIHICDKSYIYARLVLFIPWETIDLPF